MIAQAAYLIAQYRHAHAKRRKSSSVRTHRHLAALGGQVQIGPSGRVLSIGPRNIDEVEALEAQGWHVEAVDLFPTNPRIRRGDLASLPFPYNSFDLVWMSHVFEHSLSLRGSAREVARVVRPGGLVWVAVPRGGEPNPHDRWRFDWTADVTRPFWLAGSGPVAVISDGGDQEVRVLMKLTKPAHARRLLLVLTDARMVRDWVGSDLLGLLAARDHGILVLAPAALIPKIKKAVPLLSVAVEPWEPHRGPWWLRWVLRWPIRTLSYALRARWPDGEAYRHKLALRRPLRQRLGAGAARIAAALISPLCGSDVAVDSALRGVVRILTLVDPNPVSRRLLDEFRPHVVVAPTMLHEGAEIPLLWAAHRHGARIVLAVGSLDTLASKGVILVRPDRLFVWGEGQRKVALGDHDLSEGAVEVTGPPQFDIYSAPGMGQAQAKPVVYISGSSLQYWADAEAVRRMLEAAQEELGVTVHFTPHPRRSGEWEWDGSETAARLREAICLVCAWSTLSVEAALCGTPTLFVAYGRGVPRFGEWPHMRPILAWPDVRVCRSPEALIQGIRDLVSGAWVPDQVRLRTLALRQARADGHSRDRIVRAIEEAAT